MRRNRNVKVPTWQGFLSSEHEACKAARAAERKSPKYMEDGSYISSSGRLDLFHVSLYPNLKFFEHKNLFWNRKTCLYCVRFEVFTAVTMKNAVFWDVAPCRACMNRRFGGTYCLHLQGIKIRERGSSVTRVCSHLLTLVPCSRNFIPWRRSRYVPPKRRFTQYLHGATSQKTLFITCLLLE
jgi:hypothetical protein